MKNRIYIVMTAVLVLAFLKAAPAQQKASLTDVDIYLMKEYGDYNAEYDRKNPYNLFPVRRRVSKRSPLRETLRALTDGPTAAEEAQKLSSGTYGIKFVSVRLKNGTAYTYFTMPEEARFSGDGAPFLFIDVVKRTAKQFPQVKKVVVCLDGILDFWSESEDPPQRCR